MLDLAPAWSAGAGARRRLLLSPYVDCIGMAKIFISYRREDSAYATGIIRDQLTRQLPGSEIFFDVDSIPYGVDFRQHLESSVEACDYLIAVIGKLWLTSVGQDGQRRLDNPGDFVRIEVETALRRNIPLIPVILDNMPVPPIEQLPEGLHELVYRNAVFVRPPPDFLNDVDRLVSALRKRADELAQGARSQPDDQTQVPALDAPAVWAGRSAPAKMSDRSDANASPLESANRDQPALNRSHDPIRLGHLKWAMLAASLIVAATFGWWKTHAPDGPPEYAFEETFFFENAERHPVAWEPRQRMLGGGFDTQAHYIHMVVVVTYPKNTRPTKIPLAGRLLNEEAEIFNFSGVVGELPDAQYPESGKTQWIATFGSDKPKWKPGKYTVQLGTPTKSISGSFEVFDR